MYFCGKDVSVSIHNRNLHFHAIEMFKASKSMALPIIAEVFGEKNKNHYNLRHNSQYLLWYTFGISCNWQHLIPRSWNLNHLSVRLKQIYSRVFLETSCKIFFWFLSLLPAVLVKKQSYFDWNLLFFLKKCPRPSLKVFKCQICIPVK